MSIAKEEAVRFARPDGRAELGGMPASVMATLLYHHVGTPKPGAWKFLTVSPRSFEAQIAALSMRGYTGIRASHWLAYVRGEAVLPERSVLITFDDAYADIAEHALPVLVRAGFSALVLVVTGLIGKTSAWDERIGLATHPLMTAEQLRIWAARGIEFGAHSKTHIDLRGAPADVLDDEVEGSKRALEDVLGAPITAYAYPYGYFDDEARRRVAGAYSIAFTTKSGLNTRDSALDRFRRTSVLPQDSIVDVLVRARLGWNPKDFLRRGVDPGRRLLDRAG